MNLANKITMARLVLAPVIFLLIIYEKIPAAIIIIAIAFLTDILDGYVARKYRQETNLGKVLDAAADKILAFSAIFGLLWLYGSVQTNWIYGLMFFSKDILNLIFFIFSKKFRKSKKSPRILGKLVTATQAIAIFWIILRLPDYEYPVYAVFIFGIIASADYFNAFRKK